MSSQKEIEFKNLLEKEEFNRLCQTFQLTEQNFHSQTNTYFDTRDNKLRNAFMGFRLRVVGDRNELTLKAPGENVHTMIETTRLITKDERDDILKNESINPNLYEEFRHLPEGLCAFGSLRTERAEVPYKNGLLVLDRSEYVGITDYEVEYEVNEVLSGQQIFHELLKNNHIPLRATPKKIARFMKAASQK